MIGFLLAFLLYLGVALAMLGKTWLVLGFAVGATLVYIIRHPSRNRRRD